ncbi:MAG TPA: ribosomal RNA small subunit methyltransferase A [candidate division WWE3 bacterium]|uniref:Ribosomal RNA small subunit methyltransferase A n=1 Tax=candidate division WWE3 bacterium TaxID=2053526 RepID=A0A7V5MIQ3_UNCKA|nr:ribosomal RNA small subunit methyltransferase A [candidate division WWE3 bacterium]
MSDRDSQEIMQNKKSKLGQNFLIDKQAINDFINFCSIKKEDTILEIGPGFGALTKHLSLKAKKVIAIEIDTDLAYKLNTLGIENLLVLNKDFLEVNLKELVEKEKITKIIGAIPYYISSPIIHKIIEEAKEPLKEVALITQKEFAQKIIGTKKNRSYFTNLIERYAEIIPGRVIKSSSFKPKPKVDSMYFKFVFKDYPKNKEEFIKWSKFLHHVYTNPRKKINKKFKKDLLLKAGISPDIRPQNLSVEDILKILYNSYHD